METHHGGRNALPMLLTFPGQVFAALVRRGARRNKLGPAEDEKGGEARQEAGRRKGILLGHAKTRRTDARVTGRWKNNANLDQEETEEGQTERQRDF